MIHKYDIVANEHKSMQFIESPSNFTVIWNFQIVTGGVTADSDVTIEQDCESPI